MNPVRRFRDAVARRRAMATRVEHIDRQAAQAIPSHLDALAAHVTAQVRDQGDVHRGETAQAFTDLAVHVDRHRDELAAALARSSEQLAARVQSSDAALEAARRELAEHRQALLALTADVGIILQQLTQLSDANVRQHSALSESVARSIHVGRIGIEAGMADARDRVAAQLSETNQRSGARVAGLTVTMITWNHGGWLRGAVDSARAALAAVGGDFAREILVLDDGSTDETNVVLAEYALDPMVRVLRSPSNLALGRARNVLLAACRTDHAVILDADNWLLPHGVADIHAVAVKHHSTITYGHVIAATDDDRSWTTFTTAPTAETIRNGQAFDSMCVIDVAAIEALGGYSTDPNLAGMADDYELINRALRQAHLVAFVPTVIGRYRLATMRHSVGVAHMRSVERRIERSYHYDDPELESFRLIVAHPQTGVVWATPGAGIRVTPPVGPAADPIRAGGPRILLIASGGVGNLGDDAIGEVVLARIRDSLPDAWVDVVTDRGALATHGRPAPWLSTVTELWQSLTDEELALVAERAGGNWQWLTPTDRRGPFVDLGSYDAVHIAGGGNLADPFADAQARPRIAIALACHGRGVPVTWSGQGVGPCSEPLLELLRLAASCAVQFACRDRFSAELVRSESSPVTSTADDAMEHPVLGVAQFDDVLRTHDLADRRFIVAHVRTASYAAELDAVRLARAIDELADQRNATVVVVAIDNNEVPELDVAAGLAVAPDQALPWHVINAAQDAALARALVERADAVVTCSFHLALWALHSGTPAVLVETSPYYANKARALSVIAGVESIGVDSNGVDSNGVDGAGLDAVLRRVQSQLQPDRLSDAAERANEWWAQRLEDWASRAAADVSVS